MPLKKTNIVKYTTSDGRVFLGGDSKQKAQHHEEDLQRYLHDYRYIKRVADIVGMDDKLKDLTEKGLLEEYNNCNGADPNQSLDAINDEMIDELLNHAQGGCDCSDVEDMVGMICDIIDDFGGIVPVTLLYNMNKENTK